MSRRYVVEEQRLLDLEAAYAELSALERGGVDNWEYVYESYSDFLQDQALYLEESGGIDIDLEDFWFEDLAQYEIRKYPVLAPDGDNG